MAERVLFERDPDPIRKAGEFLARALRRGLDSTETVRLAIPGGSALAALGGAIEELGDDYARVELTWVDERCVPVDHPDSNRGAAQRAGWLGATFAPRHYVPLHLDGEGPADSVARTTDELAALFSSRLDVVLLGMGEDGHVASLFPSGYDPKARAGVIHVSNAPKPPPDRITLTRSLLATARATILVAAGEAKREALQRVLAGDASLPATGLPGLAIVSDLDMGEAAELDRTGHHDDGGRHA